MPTLPNKFLLTGLLLVLTGCYSFGSSQPQTFEGVAMTMSYKVIVAATLDAGQTSHIQHIIDATFEEVNQTYNNWNPHSEVSQINHLPANTLFSLSTELVSFLDQVGSMVALSAGRFDPSVAPLHTLYKTKAQRGLLPTRKETEALNGAIGWHVFHLEKNSVWKEDDKSQLDLCGIAKGYAVDLMVMRLVTAGFDNVYVEWGGEIRAHGRHSQKRPWRVAVLGKDAIIDLENSAIATSGNYLQYWHVEGKTYCHILNPKTHCLLEVKEGTISSATVIAPTCLQADAIATTLMLFEAIDKANAWIEHVQENIPTLQVWLSTSPVALKRG